MLPRWQGSLFGISAESLRKSAFGSSKSAASFSYWARTSSAGSRPRNLKYLDDLPSTWLMEPRNQGAGALFSGHSGRPSLEAARPRPLHSFHDDKYRNLSIPGGSPSGPG